MLHAVIHQPLRRLAFLGMAGALTLAAAGTALAAPRAQEETSRHGYFGSVTAVGESTFTIDTHNGQSLTVHVSEDTTFRVPGDATPAFDDVSEGARVAVLVTEDGDDLTAVHVMVVPGQPHRQHRVLTVVEVSGNTLIAEDALGNRVTVEFQREIDPDMVGEIVTFIGERSARSNRFKANAEVKIRKIVERLQDHAARLRGEADAETNAEARGRQAARLAELEARISANAKLHLERLTKVRERAPEQAKARIESVLEAARDRYAEAEARGRGGR